MCGVVLKEYMDLIFVLLVLEMIALLVDNARQMLTSVMSPKTQSVLFKATLRHSQIPGALRGHVKRYDGTVVTKAQIPFSERLGSQRRWTGTVRVTI